MREIILSTEKHKIIIQLRGTITKIKRKREYKNTTRYYDESYFICYIPKSILNMINNNKGKVRVGIAIVIEKGKEK